MTNMQGNRHSKGFNHKITQTLELFDEDLRVGLGDTAQ